MFCTICGKNVSSNEENFIKWTERQGGACHTCVQRLRKTFGKFHEHFHKAGKK